MRTYQKRLGEAFLISTNNIRFEVHKKLEKKTRPVSRATAISFLPIWQQLFSKYFI